MQKPRGSLLFSFLFEREFRRYLPFAQILALFSLSALLGACGITASQSSGQSSPPPGVTVSISPTSATVQTGGTQQFSATVANSSNTAVNWSLSGSGCLGSACGTLSSTSGSSVTYTAPSSVPSPAQVTVTATSAADSSASASASVTITTASPPPPSGFNCTGTAFAQTQSDATSQFSNVAPGVRITELTSNGANFISYMDIPVSDPAHSFICYMHTDATNRLAVCANPDGTGAQVVYDGMAGKVFVSVDGKWVYGTRGNTGGTTEDIYGVNLSASGPCVVQRITNLNMVPVTGETDAELSTSAIDTSSGLNVIAFAPGITVKRVLTDGTLLPDVNIPNANGSTFFHRLRLNPVFPNILAYKPENTSNTAGVPNEYLCDLSAGCTTATAIDTLPAGEINHGVWPAFVPSEDTNFFYQGNLTGELYEAQTLTAGGVIIPIPVNTVIGPAISTNINGCNFVSMLLDGSNGWICSSNTGTNGTDVFKMSADGATVTKLFTIPGQPQSDSGVPVVNVFNSSTFLFRADISGNAEVYAVTGF